MKDTEGHHSPEPDLIDRIANALPAEVRADYYRELTHCRSLPENDEMLRILRAILFMALLMEQVPSRVVAERERLEQLFHRALEAPRQMHGAALNFQNQLDERLACLPEHVATGINPEAIVAGINESLRQQFAKSTLPQTAEALGVVAASMKKTAAEFGRDAGRLGDAYRGAAEAARRAIGDMESTISCAAESARRAADDLTVTFHKKYRWSLYSLSCVALVVGILLGMLLVKYFDAQYEQHGKSTITAPQSAPATRPPATPSSRGKR